MLMTVCSLLFGRQVAAAEVLKGVQQFCHCEVPGIGMFIRVARHTRKRWKLHYHGGKLEKGIELFLSYRVRKQQIFSL